MTTDQKIDELLKIARENSALLGEHSTQLQEHTEQFKGQGTRMDGLGTQMDGLVNLFLEERKLNNDRFTQLASGLMEVRKEVSSVRDDMGTMKVELTSKLDKSHESLSSDINAFYEDLQETKRRVTRVEKKLHS